MKKMIIAITFLLITGICFGQKKDSTITDSTLFISLNDLNRFSNYLKDKFIVNQYEIIMQGVNAMMAQAAANYQKKKK